MSIESFFKVNPVGPKFAESVSWKGPGEISPVSFMADLLISEGSSELKIQGRDYLNTLVQDGDDEGDETMNASAIKNAAAIYFGVSIKLIEDIISSGNFEQPTFNAKLEVAFTGTPFSPTLIDRPFKEPITGERYNQIVQTASSDKTLKDFFSPEGFIYLPLSMQKALAESRTLYPIREYILPRYEDRVRLLMPNLVHRHAF